MLERCWKWSEDRINKRLLFKSELGPTLICSQPCCGNTHYVQKQWAEQQVSCNHDNWQCHEQDRQEELSDDHQWQRHLLLNDLHAPPTWQLYGPSRLLNRHVHMRTKVNHPITHLCIIIIMACRLKQQNLSTAPESERVTTLHLRVSEYS